jgi:hypothetical protein
METGETRFNEQVSPVTSSVQQSPMRAHLERRHRDLCFVLQELHARAQAERTRGAEIDEDLRDAIRIFGDARVVVERRLHDA